MDYSELANLITHEIRTATDQEVECWQVVAVFDVDNAFEVRLKHQRSTGLWLVDVRDDGGETVEVSNPAATPELAIQTTKWGAAMA